MYICMWVCGYPGRPEKDVRSPGAGVTGCCELADWYGCWERNSGPLQVILTTEPSLQPLAHFVAEKLDTVMIICFYFIEESQFLRILSFESHCRVLLFTVLLYRTIFWSILFVSFLLFFCKGWPQIHGNLLPCLPGTEITGTC